MKKHPITKEFKYKFNLWKAYLDTGRGLTDYIKYFIAVFGAYSLATNINLWFTALLLVVYFIFCFFLGWWWIKNDWMTAQIEVSNQFNLFVKQMRKKAKLYKEDV